MLGFLKQWFRKRSAKSQTDKPTAYKATDTAAQKHVHLHWHVSDVTKVSPSFVWNSALVTSSTPATIQQPQALPYDVNLLEKSRTQWQFGDWESLVKLDYDTIQNHPDRAKLALLAAAGHSHFQNNNAARQFIRLAQNWGCSKKLIAQILVSGVHNTLARAAAVSGNMPKAIEHNEAAIDTGVPYSDRLLKQARIGLQMQQLGISTPISLDEKPTKEIQNALFKVDGNMTKTPIAHK
jgi:hypothetical protein